MAARPAATGALYVARERLDECRVTFPSYFSWKLPDYELRDGALRFEGSWTPPASIRGLLASFAFAAEAGEERFAHGRAMAERCRLLLLEHGADVVTAPDHGRLAIARDDEVRSAAVVAPPEPRRMPTTSSVGTPPAVEAP